MLLSGYFYKVLVSNLFSQKAFFCSSKQRYRGKEKSLLEHSRQPSPYLCDHEDCAHMTILFIFLSPMTRRKGKGGAQPNSPQLVLG